MVSAVVDVDGVTVCGVVDGVLYGGVVVGSGAADVEDVWLVCLLGVGGLEVVGLYGGCDYEEC